MPLLFGCAQVAEEGAGPAGYGPREFSIGESFRDCAGCPEMVVIPAVVYVPGEASASANRDAVPEPFAVGAYETTRAEYGRFVSETGHADGDSCWTIRKGSIVKEPGRNWRNPGFGQAASHPAVCVSWLDAQAYVRWLSGKTGREYRLLSEAEWEHASRAGRTSGYWRVGMRDWCRFENGSYQPTCDDGHRRTSPAGSFLPNGFGLYDVRGNVREWTQGCWIDGSGGVLAGGSARRSGACDVRVVRGGSFFQGWALLRRNDRIGFGPDTRHHTVGFRVARSSTP